MSPQRRSGHHTARFLPLALALIVGVAPATAQIGDSADKAGEVQKTLVPAKLIPPSPALSPEQALSSFQVAPGFRVELVASEPLVGDPVAMAFGPDGRLWVVEMRSYMPDLDGNHEDQPTGRVVVLTDTDGDGRMDKSDVFLDRIIMPRAISLVHGGALIGAPPMLWFCRDTDGDGKADEKIEVASDYGVQTDPKRPELANPERAPNSLLWAFDNWIYSCAYTAKFRMRDGKWERGTTTFRGQWGLSQDDWGHLFYNNNSDQLRGDIVSSHYLGRNPHYLRPSGANVKVAPKQFVWPIRVTPGINRGYRPEMLRDYKLKEFTAACAPWIYRGDLFPSEFYGNAFVCEPTGNLIKRNILTSENGTLSAREAYEQREFLASTDERFRPVNLATGPDGALYIADMYRGVIQHRISLTTYLRKQSEERGLDKPIGLGRIWRVVPVGKKVPAALRMETDSIAKLVEYLSHPNSWWRETAQRFLVERRDASAVPMLEAVVSGGKAPLGRMHALWTLHGLDAVKLPVVERGLDDADPQVRAAALRVSEVLLAGNDRPALLAKWTALSRIEPVAEVQLQAALSLGEARDAAADEAMAALHQRANANVYLRDAILTGLAGRELELLEKLLSANDPKNDAFLGLLARCVASERKQPRVERLLSLIAGLPQEAAPRRLAIVSSLASHPGFNAKAPIKLAAEPAGLAALAALPEKPLGAALTKFTALLTWPGKPGAPVEKAATPLTSEEMALFATGKQLYTGVCAACHQPHGLGLEGLAPPLADSEWVLGSVERLGRIVINGVRGPIQVKGGRYNLDMPGMGVFDDQQIAAILTYIRREWGHTAAPVRPNAIKQIRAATVGRQDAWTEPELLKIP